MKTVALGLIAIALASPAVAGDKPADGKAKKPHLICKRDQNSATRMSKAVCKTAAEWAGTSVDEDQTTLETMGHQQTTLDGTGGLVGHGGTKGPSPQ